MSVRPRSIVPVVLFAFGFMLAIGGAMEIVGVVYEQHLGEAGGMLAQLHRHPVVRSWVLGSNVALMAAGLVLCLAAIRLRSSAASAASALGLVLAIDVLGQGVLTLFLYPSLLSNPDGFLWIGSMVGGAMGIGVTALVLRWAVRRSVLT